MNQILPHSAAPRFVSTPAGPLALLDTGPTPGSGQPPVLFVPGYTGSKEDFVPLLDPLADEGYRVVAVDQRGQYESPGVDDPEAYTVPVLARDVLAVIDDIGGPVHLVGHSFGGLVTRAAVIERRTAVVSLVLLDSGPGAIGGSRRDRINLLEPVLAHGGMAAVLAAMEQLAAGDPVWLAHPPELKQFLRQRFLASSEVGLKGMGYALRDEPDRVEELRATGVPLLVAYGEADDAWSPATQAAMADRLGAQQAVIPDAMHSPAVENPDELLRVLTSFWKTAGH